MTRYNTVIYSTSIRVGFTTKNILTTSAFVVETEPEIADLQEAASGIQQEGVILAFQTGGKNHFRTHSPTVNESLHEADFCPRGVKVVALPVVFNPSDWTSPKVRRGNGWLLCCNIEIRCRQGRIS